LAKHGVTAETSARTVAARVLVRVWDEGAFAAAALDAEIRRAAGLDPRDAALATELVYGVLRTRAFLEERIAALGAKKRARPLDALARAHLDMAAYSIAFLDRVPVFAAVSEAVDGIAAATDARVGGYANAVLRRFADSVAQKRPSLTDAIAQSAPGWLRGALRRALGRAGASEYLTAGPVPPPIGLCVARVEERHRILGTLRAALPSASFEPGRASPRAILVRGAGDVRKLPGEGTDFIVQEEGSQVVALSLGARHGERVLDACAGRGNKAFSLHHAVGEEGVVDAADLYPQKLETLATRGLARASYAVDWTIGPGDVPEGYDRVLVDAPCSGIGTLRRRPEIGLTREECDLAELSALQCAIVRSAATRVRSGGRLVFAVCSVLREEAEDVVAALTTEAGPGLVLEPAPFDSPVVAELSSGATSMRLLPHAHGTDGYFIASFVVRRGG
jgi:16S rRNA (cytosine967-C5)-methyltransferase